MADDRRKFSPQQLSILFDEIEKDPLLYGKVEIHQREEYAAKWEELARKLNAVKGSVKSSTRWQQSWRDWRSKAQKRATKILSEPNEYMSDLDKRFIILSNKVHKGELYDLEAMSKVDPLSNVTNISHEKQSGSSCNLNDSIDYPKTFATCYESEDATKLEISHSESEGGKLGRKFSSEQLTILIDEMEKDPLLMYGRIELEQRGEYTSKWDQLVQKLNAVQNGAVKSTARWQQSWRDWRAKTHKKSEKLLSGNYDGDAKIELSDQERRFILFSKGINHEQILGNGGIDISALTDIGAVSSESDDDDPGSSADSKDSVPPADYVTTYEPAPSQSTRVKRSQSEERDFGRIKRRRIKMVSTETISRQHQEIMARLDALERSQQEFQKQQSDLLVAILSSMERQLAMENRLGDAVNRIADFIENRVGPGG